jgi:hypothetical protein
MCLPWKEGKFLRAILTKGPRCACQYLIVLTSSDGWFHSERLTSVGHVKERNLGRPRNRQVQRINPIIPLLKLPKQARHKQSQLHKRAGDAAVANILLNLGFTVKVADVGEAAVGDLLGIDEGGEDDVLHAGGFAGVDDGFALGDFGGGGHGLPEVGDEEDGVGAGYGWGGGLLGRHVGLRCPS